MGGRRSQPIFYKMVGQLEQMTLMPNLNFFKEAYEKKDVNEYKFRAHTMKGACGYIGAGPLYYSCLRIQLV